jgi:hypothetical protein
VFHEIVKDLGTGRYDTIWAMYIVSALSKNNETESDENSDADDESDSDHEFALRLERAALATLESRGQKLHCTIIMYTSVRSKTKSMNGMLPSTASCRHNGPLAVCHCPFGSSR